VPVRRVPKPAFVSLKGFGGPGEDELGRSVGLVRMMAWGKNKRCDYDSIMMVVITMHQSFTVCWGWSAGMGEQSVET